MRLRKHTLALLAVAALAFLVVAPVSAKKAPFTKRRTEVNTAPPPPPPSAPAPEEREEDGERGGADDSVNSRAAQMMRASIARAVEARPEFKELLDRAREGRLVEADGPAYAEMMQVVKEFMPPDLRQAVEAAEQAHANGLIDDEL